MQIQYYFVVFPISYKNIFPSQKSAQSAQSVKSVKSVQSVQSVVSWGIKEPEGPEGVEEAEEAEDVKDTCRYERYVETSFLCDTLRLCERLVIFADVYKNRKAPAAC